MLINRVAAAPFSLCVHMKTDPCHQIVIYQDRVQRGLIEDATVIHVVQIQHDIPANPGVRVAFIQPDALSPPHTVNVIEAIQRIMSVMAFDGRRLKKQGQIMEAVVPKHIVFHQHVFQVNPLGGNC